MRPVGAGHFAVHTQTHQASKSAPPTTFYTCILPFCRCSCSRILPSILKIPHPPSPPLLLSPVSFLGHSMLAPRKEGLAKNRETLPSCTYDTHCTILVTNV